MAIPFSWHPIYLLACFIRWADGWRNEWSALIALISSAPYLSVSSCRFHCVHVQKFGSMHWRWNFWCRWVRTGSKCLKNWENDTTHASLLCAATARKGIAERNSFAAQQTASQHTFFSVKVIKNQALFLSKNLQGEPKNLLLLLYSEVIFVWCNKFVSIVVSMWSYLTVSHVPLDASRHADGNFASVLVWWAVALHLLSTKKSLEIMLAELA